MMAPFLHAFRAQRVRVDDDFAEAIVEEVELLGCRRVLLVCSAGQRGYAEQLHTALGPLSAGIFAEAREHVPRATVTAAQAALAGAGADGCVTVGGGSATGLGKALALESPVPLPLLSVVTTYAGSEATSIWGITEAGRKTTGRDVRVAPASILYIPSWTLGLPVGLSSASGLNAIAHCVEALYAHDASPLTRLLAEEGIRALSLALPRILADPGDREARTLALWGAHLSGRALDGAAMGLHHKLCHVLGGSFQLPHAATHAIVLPYAAAYNAPAAPAAMAAISRALGQPGIPAPEGLAALRARLEIPDALAALGLRAEDIPLAVTQILEKTYPNPRPMEAAGLTALLEDALHGRPPRADY